MQDASPSRTRIVAWGVVVLVGATATTALAALGLLIFVVGIQGLGWRSSQMKEIEVAVCVAILLAIDIGVIVLVKRRLVVGSTGVPEAIERRGSDARGRRTRG